MVDPRSEEIYNDVVARIEVRQTQLNLSCCGRLEKIYDESACLSYRQKKNNNNNDEIERQFYEEKNYVYFTRKTFTCTLRGNDLRVLYEEMIYVYFTRK